VHQAPQSHLVYPPHALQGVEKLDQEQAAARRQQCRRHIPTRRSLYQGQSLRQCGGSLCTTLLLLLVLLRVAA
jgi:hypothetical protein